MGTTAFELVLIHRIQLAIALHRAMMYRDAADELRRLGKLLRKDPSSRRWHKDVWVAVYDMGPVLEALREHGLVEEGLATELRHFYAMCLEQKVAAHERARLRLEEMAELDQIARSGDPSPVSEAFDA